MDPKRKKIYIIIIAICFLGSGIVLILGNSGGSSSPAPAPDLSTTPTTDETADVPATPAPDSGAPMTYAAPPVFPANGKIDTSILDSNSVFQTLKANPALTLDPSELGRDNPFNSY